MPDRLRMNRLVVRQAAAGLAQYLLDTDPDCRERGVVIGYDARRKSDVFASDTARVMAAYGIKSMLFDQKVPTPVLAWSVTELDAAAGVVVTASHNPPADNGYKVYLGDGAQIVPPHDVGISECIEAVDPTAVPIADDGHPLIHSVGEELIAAYVAAIPAVRRRPDLAGVPVAYTPMHGVGGAVVLRAFDGGRIAEAGRRRRAVRARRHVSHGLVPEPGGAGRDGSPARGRPPRRRPCGDRQRS